MPVQYCPKLDNTSKACNYFNTPFNKYLFSLFAAGSVFNTDSVGVLGPAGTQKISLAKQPMPPQARSLTEWSVPKKIPTILEQIILYTCLF